MEKVFLDFCGQIQDFPVYCLPLTKSGRERKIGRIITGGGCLVMAAFWVVIPVTMVVIIYKLI